MMDKYRKSLSDIGWTEEQIVHYNAIALADHSLRGDMARKKSERQIVGKFLCMQEGIQGPVESAQ